MSESVATPSAKAPPAAVDSALGEDFIDFIINNNPTNPVFHQLDNASVDYQPAGDGDDDEDQQQQLPLMWSPPPQNAQQFEDLPLPTQTRKKRKLHQRRPLQPRKLVFREEEDMAMEGVQPLMEGAICLLPKMDARRTGLHVKALSFYCDDLYKFVTDDKLKFGESAPSTNHRIYLSGGTNLVMVYNHCANRQQSIWLNSGRNGSASNIHLTRDTATTLCEWVMDLDSPEPATDISCAIGNLLVKYGNGCITVTLQGNRKCTVYIPINSAESLAQVQKNLQTFKLGTGVLDLRSKLKKDLRIFVQSDEFNSCNCSHGGREHLYAFHYSQDISKILPIRWVHGEIAPSDTLPFWG